MKTSNQKAQEEYEQEFERRKQEREAAQRFYKKKKMEVFNILSKKTIKGQPNLNLQMEYRLQKIQENKVDILIPIRVIKYLLFIEFFVYVMYLLTIHLIFNINWIAKLY
uniref:Uncharacterized protein n=1 Tax=Molossus molossus TaxID=27622 RepID=A0A7J8FW32_MOLMO|nr:hypothetical protein HJG59_002289 [Molossus molossus]